MSAPHSQANLQAFQSEVSQIADDIAVTWDPNIERYRVWQVKKKSDFQDLQHRIKYEAHLIFTVQEKDGSYRPLDKRTLYQIARAVELGHSIWKLTPDQLEDKLNRAEESNLQKARDKRREEIDERIKEIAPFYLGKKKHF